MLHLHFFLQGSAPFWKKIQLELKSFWAPADAIFDVYIIFIGMNDAKKGNNNYRYSFYTQLIPHVKLGPICSKFGRFQTIFHVIKIGSKKKIARCTPERWFYFYLIRHKDHGALY